eukprot:gene36905-3084_t
MPPCARAPLSSSAPLLSLVAAAAGGGPLSSLRAVFCIRSEPQPSADAAAAAALAAELAAAACTLSQDRNRGMHRARAVQQLHHEPAGERAGWWAVVPWLGALSGRHPDAEWFVLLDATTRAADLSALA